MYTGDLFCTDVGRSNSVLDKIGQKITKTFLS